LNKDSEQHIGT